jgi:tetratricopeptide (TPR) repeat protein
VEEGFATSLEALEIAESSGDILSRAVAHVCHGISCFYKGIFAEAEELLLKGIELCDRIHLNSFSPVAHQGLGCTYFETGAYDKSKDHHRKAILLRRKTGIFPSCAKMNEVALARAAFAGGKMDLDLASLRELLTTVKSKPYRGATARYLADILFRMGEYYFEEAESSITAAIVDHERLGMKWDLAHDYLVLGQSLKSTGRGAEATGFLEKAWSLFNDCGADGWRQRIESV